MKVYIDTSPLTSGHKVRGVGFYTKELIKALEKDKGVLLVKSPKDADVIHYPFFDLFFLTLSPGRNKPTVVTVHDVIPLLYPKQYAPGFRGKAKFLIQKKRLQNVDAIITDSETSRKDIVRLLNIPQEKVFVTHLAPAEHFKQLKIGNWKLEIKNRYGLPERFVLYVGDVNDNKNVQGLVNAFAHLPEELRLVLVGKGFEESSLEAKSILELIKYKGLEAKTKVLGFIPDEDLVKIYNLASVVCLPSFYEGFGLPVLEAQRCGTPVVASKAQCLVEMSGDSAVFINPHDTKEMANALRSVLDNKTLRSRIVRAGLENAKSYSWGKTAKETIAIYNRLLSQ